MIDHAHKLDGLNAMRAEVSKVVLGQAALIDKLLIALLADGHILLEEAPGLAKTQVIAALGSATGGCFRRIQLLPDMLPSDITGTLIYHPDAGCFQVQKGPILDTHFLLADEINRPPLKCKPPFCKRCKSAKSRSALTLLSSMTP